MQAAQEAERLAAPAEAHRHFDAAQGLWERVSEPEKLAGHGPRHAGVPLRDQRGGQRRGGPRAVHELRRLRGYLGDSADPALTSRVRERLSYFLLETGAVADAVEAAQAAVDALPEDPPSWERARALATLRPDAHVRPGRGGRDPGGQAGPGGGPGGRRALGGGGRPGDAG